MTPVEILKKAKEIFETKDLNKGCYFSPYALDLIDTLNLPFFDSEKRIALVAAAKGVCASGAIYGVGADPRETRLAVLYFAQINHLGHIHDIPDWNDNPCRTKEEVIAAFELATVVPDHIVEAPLAKICTTSVVTNDNQQTTGENNE